MKILNSKKQIYGLAGLTAAGSCMIMVAFPGIAMESAQKGVSLWASSVLPALLPFFICVNFMTKLGLPRIIGKAFERPFRTIFGAPGVSAFVFTVSITSGYPMGAKIIGDLGREGQITRSEARQMLSFCTTSGPLFMLGAVGAGMLGSPAAGLVIALSHYLGAVLNGIFYRVIGLICGNRGSRGCSLNEQDMESQEKKNRRSEEVGHGVPWGEHSHHGAASILEMFTDAILSSLKSLGIICGYIVLFTMFTDFLVYSGLLSGMSEVGVAVVKGIFEMTVGCGSIAEVGGLSLTVICAISSFFISFGGISIMAQSMSMMSGLGISTFSYVKAKLTHGIFALVIAFIAGPSFLSGAALETALLNGPVSGTAMPYESFNMMAGLDGIYCLFFSAKMVIMLVIVMLSILAAEGMIGRKKYKRSQE